jgi:hypothetical protein
MNKILIAPIKMNKLLLRKILKQNLKIPVKKINKVKKVKIMKKVRVKRKQLECVPPLMAPKSLVTMYK